MSTPSHSAIEQINKAALATSQVTQSMTYPTVSITVDQLEVTLHPEGLDQRDVHFDRTGFLTAEKTQRAYEILAERHFRELDEIAAAIAKGELE